MEAIPSVLPPYRRPTPHEDNLCEANDLRARYRNQLRIVRDRGFDLFDASFHHPFTHTDGIVASIIDDDLVTSPNSPRIPFPPFGHRVVRLREDLLYGPDDHLRWPQPYVDIYPHYACILLPDPSDTSAQSYLYKKPADIGVQSARTLAQGLYTLTSEALKNFNDIGKSVRGKLKQLVDDARAREQPLPASAQGYDATVVHTIARLQGIGFERTTLMLLVREVQRVLLETDAFVRYWSVYRPRFTDAWPDGGRPRPADLKLLGAFVRDSDVALQFANAGIPVYVIRPLLEVPLDTTHVLKWVTPDVPAASVQLQDRTPKFPPVWIGTAEHRGKYINMHRFTVTHLVFRDPWGEEVPVYNDSEFDPILRASPTMGILPRPASSSTVMFSPLPKGPLPNDTIARQKVLYAVTSAAAASSSSSGPTTSSLGVSSSSSQASSHISSLKRGPSSRLPGPKKKKSKDSQLGFQLPQDPANMPLPPRSWQHAFETVQVDLSLPSRHSREDRLFFFPPSSLFTSSSRQGNNTLNYLFLRSAWIGHLMTEPHPRGLLAQDWRDLLGWSAYRTSTSANPSDMGPSERRARELLGSIFGKRDLNQLPPSVDFNGSQLSTDHLPEHEVYWDLAWEVNEANARLDLVRFLMHGVDDGNILARTDLVEGIIFPQSQTNTTASFWTPSAMDFVELDGLCLKDWQERLLWVLSLGRAVSQCPAGSAVPEGLSFLASLEDEQIRHFGCNSAQAHSLEEAIITHYCTCFYNTFSRPPTPPRCLF